MLPEPDPSSHNRAFRELPYMGKELSCLHTIIYGVAHAEIGKESRLLGQIPDDFIIGLDASTVPALSDMPE